MKERIKKKVGIITINDERNIGNRLQNYAVQQIVKKLKFQCENIIYLKNCNKNRRKESIKNKLKPVVAFFLYILNIKKEKCGRILNFYGFSKKIKNFKIKITKESECANLNKYFDFFVTGSDQVWNPILYPNMYINMLGFTENSKKIAMAPSISVDSLSVEQEKMFKELLKDFDNLSCREEQGAELLRKITGKKVISLIDPTLMLSCEEWNKVSKKPKFHEENKKYILLYFLGELTEKYKNIINDLSKMYNLEIINILDKKSKYYSCGPSEFIYMIKNCSIMLTDSFHGSVFSYIYNKPFRIFYREGGCGYMNSRLTNLMEKLHLDESTYLKGNDKLKDIMKVNYNKEYLKAEQQKFENYVNSVLIK